MKNTCKKLLFLMAIFALNMALLNWTNIVNAEGGCSFVPNRILVKFKQDVNESAKEKLHKKYGTEVLDVIPRIDIQILKIPIKTSVTSLIKEYQKDPNVRYAEPDYVLEFQWTRPNDSYYGLQWALPRVDVATVCKLVGHANPNVTYSIYAHSHPERLKEGILKAF